MWRRISPSPLQVDDAKDVMSAPIRIQFDPKLLSLNEITRGAFWIPDGEEPLVIRNLQNDAGTASIQLTRKPGTPGVSGAGAMLTLSFKAVGRGNSKISATNVTVINSQSQAVGSGSPQITVNVK